MAPAKDDLVVNIADSPSSSAKPGAELGAHSGAGGAGGAVQRAKDWLNRRPRNKAIAGGALASVLLLPAIIAPAVIASQKQSAARRMRVPDWGAYSGASSKYAYGDPLGNPDEGFVPSKPGSSKLPKGMKIPNFGSLAETNASIKVPKASGRDLANITKFGTEAASRFVAIEGGQFDKDCRPFYPTGFNGFELFILAAQGNRDAVDDAFRQARAMGMTAARTWAHSINQALPFQTGPGAYDPQGLAALDYVLDSASRHGVQLILSFIDNWKYYNGVAQFVDWCGPGRTMQRPVDAGGDTDDSKWSPDMKRYESGRHSLFFSEPACHKLFQDHVKFIVNRKNSINGRTYKEDPTILAWNLINEPRCEKWVTPDCPAKLDAWYSKMAAYVKSVDRNHLVSSGSEGFFGDSDPSYLGKNPASWATETGQDFLLNNKDMDFAVTHAWPDNWMIAQGNQGRFLKEWLQSHLEAAKAIGKPLLFEEFGKRLDSDNAGDIAALRDPVYTAAYKAIEDAVEGDEPLLGSMYWKWAFPDYGKGPYGVAPSDSTMKVIRDHSAKMYKLMNSVPPRPSCLTPPAGAAAAAPGAAPPAAGAVGAWFGAGAAACVNDPAAAAAWYLLYGPDADPASKPADFVIPKDSLARAKALSEGNTSVFPSKAACCAPNTGAFTAGCA